MLVTTDMLMLNCPVTENMLLSLPEQGSSSSMVLAIHANITINMTGLFLNLKKYVESVEPFILIRFDPFQSDAFS